MIAICVLGLAARCRRCFGGIAGACAALLPLLHVEKGQRTRSQRAALVRRAAGVAQSVQVQRRQSVELSCPQTRAQRAFRKFCAFLSTKKTPFPCSISAQFVACARAMRWFSSYAGRGTLSSAGASLALASTSNRALTWSVAASHLATTQDAAADIVQPRLARSRLTLSPHCGLTAPPGARGLR